jgi:pectinesterase
MEAAIWHDGSGGKEQKTVLKDCTFSGDDGFKLGRFHKDAQFYLLNCTFAKNMADAPIFQVATTNDVKYGKRVYFYNCHRDGKDLAWLKNNLTEAAGAPDPSIINVLWAFDNKWNPLLTDN